MKKQLQELIHEAKAKYRTSENLINLRNYLNESYQEHEFLNMKNSFERLIHNLEHLAKQETVNSKCFANILAAPNKFSSSLMSLCLSISQVLQEESRIKILHQHHSSQVIFLALFLKFTQPDKYVSIVTTKNSFKNWQKYLIDPKSNDPESDMKSLLNEVKITFHFIDESYGDSITHSNQILIFDLMNAEVVDYKPLLLNLKPNLSIPQKIIVYHSHVDQVQVENTLNQLHLEFFAAEASQTYPIEINFIEKDAEIKEKLVEFLKQDANHPQKQDIIIFYKNEHLQNSTAKRYTHKLNQLLAQHRLQSNVQYICSKNEILQTGRNHIFIAQNTDQLLEWNYSYEDVLFVIDYGWNVSYRMDHERNCFVEGLNRNCLREKTRRLAFVGISKVGKYIYAEDQFSETLNYLDRVKELMTYILRMTDLGLSDALENQNERLKRCVQSLTKNEIIKKDENGKLVILNEEILKLNKLGVDPIQSKIINLCLQKEKQKQSKTLSNLVIMALSIINTRGNLRQVRQNLSAHATAKPTGIWRKSGYLDSCIQILTKAEIIESGKNSKKSMSKASKSKIEEEYIDGFGSLFDAEDLPPQGRVKFEDMKMDDLLKEYFVSDHIFAEIRNNIDELRELFGVEQTNINFDQALLNEVIETVSSIVSESVAIFSGSRRLGYKYNSGVQVKSSVFPHRQCLMAQLNETPQFVMILRCTENENKREIFMCNTVHVDSFMTIFGALPPKKSDSLAEHEIEFHGISSSIFKGLFRNNGITIDMLHQTIDEIFLEKAFVVYGEIQNVEILKTPLKEPPNPESLIDYILKDTLQIPQNEDINGRYKINTVEKHKNGLRKCRVLIKTEQHLNILINKLNEVKGKIGEGRLYAESMFTKPILIVYPSAVHLYENLLEEVLTKDPQRPNVHYALKDYGRHRNYIILSSPFKRALDYVSAEFEKRLKPRQIKLTSLQKTIILSEVGISNLIDLEEKYNCKLVVNSQKKTLEVICKISDLNKITEEVNGRVEDKFFYRISLNSRSYKNLSKDPAKLEEIKTKYFLSLLEIEEYSKTLIFEGSANHVQSALNYMMHLIESFVKSEQEMINSEVCLICYEEPNKPYRLQNCGHKFCFGCLDQCINSILGDITMFPIKCPHCMVELTVDDLETLIDAGSWPKLINMGVTQYVNKNTQIMSFCYTAGCKQINMLKINSFKCDMCAVAYCTECKQHLHEGLTCQEAKQGGDALFKKYMEENDVRICPNKDCKMPIVRTDGCYRVTCSRCNKSMCFKCPANKMIAYNDYNDCYKHLNDQHGGYW